MNTLQCVRALRQLGVPVEGVHRTGEMRVHLPNGRAVTFQHPRRRKDASNILLLALKRWQAHVVGAR